MGAQDDVDLELFKGNNTGLYRNSIWSLTLGMVVILSSVIF